MTTTATTTRRPEDSLVARPTLANYWHPIARAEDVTEARNSSSS